MQLPTRDAAKNQNQIYLPQSVTEYFSITQAHQIINSKPTTLAIKYFNTFKKYQ